jgi:hypothetical protein
LADLGELKREAGNKRTERWRESSLLRFPKLRRRQRAIRCLRRNNVRGDCGPGCSSSRELIANGTLLSLI